MTVCGVEARACSLALSLSSEGAMEGVGCVGFSGEDVARGDGEVGVVAVSVGWVVILGELLDCC